MKTTEDRRKNRGVIQMIVVCLMSLQAAVAPAAAQQVTGTPGSPSATPTIDGKQIPPPPPKFGGVIKESAKDSTPWWPPRIVPPKGAPNVLLIMTDDQGRGVSGTFPENDPAHDSIAHLHRRDHDIGIDTRKGMDDNAYRVPFHFTGTINKLTYKLGPEQLSVKDKQAAAKVLAAARD